MDDKEKEKDNEKHDGADHIEEEEEDEDGHKRVVILGPQVPLKEQLELDKVSALTSSSLFWPFRKKGDILYVSVGWWEPKEVEGATPWASWHRAAWRWY